MSLPHQRRNDTIWIELQIIGIQLISPQSQHVLLIRQLLFRLGNPHLLGTLSYSSSIWGSGEANRIHSASVTGAYHSPEGETTPHRPRMYKGHIRAIRARQTERTITFGGELLMDNAVPPLMLLPIANDIECRPTSRGRIKN